PMNWQAVIDNPLLRDLPFKIEQNRFGQIVMSPAGNRHGLLQVEVATYLKRRAGRVLVETSIETEDGVKVADVAWASEAFIERNGFETPYREAPELCVEIVSPSDSQEEMDHKISLYLARGAREVWLCSESGEVRVFAGRGETPDSELYGEKPSFEDLG
ncbi:MAG: Uma2 family endonuclease, partial [Acidobacteriota bacterium]